MYIPFVRQDLQDNHDFLAFPLARHPPDIASSVEADGPARYQLRFRRGRWGRSEKPSSLSEGTAILKHGER